MKLVLQIAGGIVLAFFVIAVLVGAATVYQSEQAAKEIASWQQASKIRNAKFREKMRRKIQADKAAKAPVSDVAWSSNRDLVIHDSSAMARQWYLESEKRKNRIAVNSSPQNEGSQDSKDLNKNKEILDQLIKNKRYN